MSPQSPQVAPARHQEHTAVTEMRELLDQNNLEFHFSYYHPVRVHASIKMTELKMPRTSGLLTSISGRGKSEEDALRALAQSISGGRLIYHATGGKLRREVDVPHFTQDDQPPPEENEISLLPRGEKDQSRSCQICGEHLRPMQPRWEIKNTDHRICQPCLRDHRIFIGEPLRPQIPTSIL